jgi:hypothetical protein
MAPHASQQHARCSRAPARLLDLVVVALVPQAVGRAHEAVVVPAVHGVAGVHEHAEELVRLRAGAPVAHVRRQVQPRAKVHLPRIGLGFASMRGRVALHVMVAQQRRNSTVRGSFVEASGRVMSGSGRGAAHQAQNGCASKRAAQCFAMQGVLALHKQG